MKEEEFEKLKKIWREWWAEHFGSEVEWDRILTALEEYKEETYGEAYNKMLRIPEFQKFIPEEEKIKSMEELMFEDLAKEIDELKKEIKRKDAEIKRLRRSAEKVVRKELKKEYEETIKKLEEEIDKLKDEKATLEERLAESRKRIKELEEKIAKKRKVWVPPEKYWFVHVIADMPPGAIWISPLDNRYYGAYLECEWVVIPRPEYDPTVKNLIHFFKEIPRMSPGDVHDVWKVAEEILRKAGYRPSKYRLDIMSQIDWNETKEYNIALIRRIAEEFVRAMAIKAVPRVRAPEALPPELRAIAEKFGLLEEKYVDIESMPEFEEFLSQIGISLRYYRIMDKLEREALRDAFRKWYAERYLKGK